jgi:NAD(P)-dependent dehydrogenase (short-subunit alcohol dehydrogenase family)
VDLNFTGKTIIVTGAGSGVGRAIAIGFARRGALVLATDFDEANLFPLEPIILYKKLFAT